MEDVTVMRPELCSTIVGITARIDLKTPARSVEIMSSHSGSEQDVHLAELGNCPLDDTCHRRTVGEAGLHRHTPLVERLDQLHRLGEIVGSGHRVVDRRRLRSDVTDDDVRSLPAERQCVVAALAPGAFR
jgi:hypothetical protein